MPIFLVVFKCVSTSNYTSSFILHVTFLHVCDLAPHPSQVNAITGALWISDIMEQTATADDNTAGEKVSR